MWKLVSAVFLIGYASSKGMSRHWFMVLSLGLASSPIASQLPPPLLQLRMGHWILIGEGRFKRCL